MREAGVVICLSMTLCRTKALRSNPCWLCLVFIYIFFSKGIVCGGNCPFFLNLILKTFCLFLFCLFFLDLACKAVIHEKKCHFFPQYFVKEKKKTAMWLIFSFIGMFVASDWWFVCIFVAFHTQSVLLGFIWVSQIHFLPLLGLLCQAKLWHNKRCQSLH